MLEEETTGSNLSRKATLLMAEVLQMANRVLPLSIAAKLQVYFTLIFARSTSVMTLLVGCSAHIQSRFGLQRGRTPDCWNISFVSDR